MEETMTWILVGTATLGAFAFGVLNAWLLLKIALSPLTRRRDAEDIKPKPNCISASSASLR